MLDKQTREQIKYLAMVKQKEQLEKEIAELKKDGFKYKYGIKKENLNHITNYFKD